MNVPIIYQFGKRENHPKTCQPTRKVSKNLRSNGKCHYNISWKRRRKSIGINFYDLNRANVIFLTAPGCRRTTRRPVFAAETRLFIFLWAYSSRAHAVVLSTHSDNTQQVQTVSTCSWGLVNRYSGNCRQSKDAEANKPWSESSSAECVTHILILRRLKCFLRYGKKLKKITGNIFQFQRLWAESVPIRLEFEFKNFSFSITAWISKPRSILYFCYNVLQRSRCSLYFSTFCCLRTTTLKVFYWDVIWFGRGRVNVNCFCTSRHIKNLYSATLIQHLIHVTAITVTAATLLVYASTNSVNPSLICLSKVTHT